MTLKTNLKVKSCPSWEKQVSQSIITIKDLKEHTNFCSDNLIPVIEQYPMRINPYFLGLVLKHGAPLARQVIPDLNELLDKTGMVDPLAEDRDSPVRNITHRYPDRVLFLVSGQCAVYCRFCTRKRKIGHFDPVTDEIIDEGCYYIRSNSNIKDVLISGGDPLMLSDERLEWILSRIRDIPHVETIRIGTRIPSALPQRITPQLVLLLSRFQPVYVNIHFNHPYEITEETEQACRLFTHVGISLASQTVLLKDINDNPLLMADLMRRLLKMNVRPYYLLQADLVKGTNHFRTRIETGIRIMKYLRGNVSGMAVPTYVIDLPGGGGKVPLLPEYIIDKNHGQFVFRNFQDKVFKYSEP